MFEFSDVLMIGWREPKFEVRGIHTVEYWGGDHHFHHNKFNLYNLFGQREKLYGFTKEDIQRHHRFVIFENGKAHWVIDDIRKWNPTANIKFVMGNIVADYGNWKIREIQKRGVQVFSFDQDDCDKYGLTRYPGFCFYEGNIVTRPIKNDVYFIGKDKGRADYILDLKRKLDKYGVSCNFNVVLEKSKYSEGNFEGVQFLKNGISYSEVLNGISESKVILDVVQKGQRGPTMRPFESLFYNRKLITNNLDAVNLDFYCLGNIMVLENDNIESVVDFIKKPINEYADIEKEKYTIENFVRFVFKN